MVQKITLTLVSSLFQSVNLAGSAGGSHSTFLMLPKHVQKLFTFVVLISHGECFSSNEFCSSFIIFRTLEASSPCPSLEEL